MKLLSDSKKERERLKSLESYSILDTLPEADYDDITAIAAEICGTPISLVSLIDEKRQWFKSHHGINIAETPKEFSFCALAIQDPNSVFIVPDARSDSRFRDNPVVYNAPHVVFYAGVPLVGDDGFALGTLCVIDKEPRKLTDGQLKSLKALSHQLMNVLTLRKNRILLEKAYAGLEERNKELEKFAYIAAHDLRSPLINIKSLTDLFIKDHAARLNADANSMLKMIQLSSEKLRILIDDLLEYSRSETIIREKKVTINLSELIDHISRMFSFEKNLSFQLNSSIKEIIANKTALEQVLINLFSNAIKYNDKEIVKIEITVSEDETHYEFCVKDNGPGISDENKEKVFEIFETLNLVDKSGQMGNGIGLATVKKIVERCGGLIGLETEKNSGACFKFTIEK